MKAPYAATIGFIGGGQLAKMLAIAAARLGMRSVVFTPDPQAPAIQVTSDAVIADYSDPQALARFANMVDVITCEFENVPATALAILEEHTPVHPSPNIMHIAQHRLREKAFFTAQEIPTVGYQAVTNAQELEQAVATIGLPAVLKSCMLGYDGKGQYVLRSAADVAAVQSKLADAPEWILEQFIPFASEASIIVARSDSGMLVTYPPTENQHEQGILRHSKVPANITQITANALENYGKRIAEALQLQGLLAIEFFVLGNGKLLANEMAPRPHNSGHWTIEAALTCQFEQTIRAVMDWPLGDCSLIHPVEMTNIIGTEIEQWQDLLSEGSAKLHLYGKSTPTPGRKMGHVTRFVGI